MLTLPEAQLRITPIDAHLSSTVTGLDTSQPATPDTILRLKQALRNYH